MQLCKSNYMMVLVHWKFIVNTDRPYLPIAPFTVAVTSKGLGTSVIVPSYQPKLSSIHSGICLFINKKYNGLKKNVRTILGHSFLEVSTKFIQAIIVRI